MNREIALNTALALGLPAVALIAQGMGETFTITLATKVAIFALADAGLNIALGFGGLVSFGHAAFFGIGGYAAGILVRHAMYYEPVLTWPVTLEGTQSMPVIWAVAIVASGLAALAIGALSLRTCGVFFIMITLAFAQIIYYFAISWPTYGGGDGCCWACATPFRASIRSIR
ncbi:branched-chain amino acid ABC transporter permease [Breoghania sp.]|uniref:branched-chain amino acid ABC transporter permease n=1 Tax=Breoghania sp. TaxID=2065378 RepID=UPI003204A7B4